MRLVLEGGGTRAAFSAGILLALERAGVPCDAVVGSSTGAVNAAYFAAGQMDVCARVWTDAVPNGFVSYRRLLTPWGRPGLDVDRMVDVILQEGWSTLDHERALAGPTHLYIVATHVPSGEPVLGRPGSDDLFDWMRASCALPVGYNRVVEIDGAGYVDGGISAPVPVDLDLETPFSGPTIAVLTRRSRKRKGPPNWWQRALLRLMVPEAIRGPSMRQHELYNHAVQRLQEEHEAGRLLLVIPPEEMTLSRLTTDPAAIRRGIDIGLARGESLVRELEA